MSLQSLARMLAAEEAQRRPTQTYHIAAEHPATAALCGTELLNTGAVYFRIAAWLRTYATHPIKRRNMDRRSNSALCPVCTERQNATVP